MAQRPLTFRAGPAARARLLTEGLHPETVGAVTAAAGGPKFLAICGLDRFLFHDWLSARREPLPLVGSSSGAWRFAALAQPDAMAAHERLTHTYINQRFDAEPDAAAISASAVHIIDTLLGADGARGIAEHPFARVHFVTTRCRSMTALRSPLAMKSAFAVAAAANAAHRGALQAFFRREVFHDPRPGTLEHRRFPGFGTRFTALEPGNLRQALLASASIPLLMEPVRIGQHTYLDGAIIDYHMDLPLSDDGIVLAPHFSSRLMTGWLDGFAPWRHPAHLGNTLVVHPSDEWIASLPDGVIPTRQDFYRYKDNDDGRVSMWQEVVRRSGELADCLADVLEQQNWRQVLADDPGSLA